MLVNSSSLIHLVLKRERHWDFFVVVLVCMNWSTYVLLLFDWLVVVVVTEVVVVTKTIVVVIEAMILDCDGDDIVMFW